MDPCKTHETLIEKMLADELDGEAMDRLLAHAERCAACREFVDLHHQLFDSELASELPADREFLAMRRNVLRRIRADEQANPGWLERLRLLLAPAAPRPLAALGAVALLAVVGVLGVMAGMQMGETPIVAAGILPELSREARSNELLADAENSRFVYSNVALRETGEGTMAMSFDVTRHMTLERPTDDPLVKEVLVQSLLSPSTVGSRLQAVSYAGSMIDPKVKQVLILTMLNDPSQAVRQKSLQILDDYRDDPEVQDVLLAVLRGDEAVGMRLMALEALAESDLSAERLSGAMQDFDRIDDHALLVRAADLRGDDAALPAIREGY